jgi:hypothetical protein
MKKLSYDIKASTFIYIICSITSLKIQSTFEQHILLFPSKHICVHLQNMFSDALPSPKLAPSGAKSLKLQNF